MSTGSVTVTVYDASGAALSGATVTTIPATTSATTAADGTATIPNIAIGSWLVTANKPGLQADGTSVTVVANGTSTATLRLGAGAEFALARIVGIPGAYQDLLPGTEKRLTTNSVSQQATANQIHTNGVANVPVKQYVYMRAATEDAAGVAITGQTWSIASDVGANPTLESWDGTTVSGTARTWVAATTTTPATAADVRFRPILPGVYTVTITATTATGSSTAHLKVYAGTYVGVAACASCHSNAQVVGAGNDVYGIWSLTGHATKFEKYYGAYSWSSDYCVQCHTTGYDESTVSGFADMAKESGWNPAAAASPSACTTTAGVTTCATVNSVVAWAKYAPQSWTDIFTFIADPATQPMQKLMNIQCESCHGPGSNHPEAASHKTWDPSVCGQCHGQPAQWALSGHAKPISPKEWASASCMPCHSGQGFVVAKVQNKPIVFPDQAFPGYPATVFERGMIQPIGCVTCHDPHLGNGTKSSQLRLESTSYTAPMGFTVTAGESAACKTCHVNKRDTTYFTQFLAGQQSRGPHMTQTDMLTGKGGAEFSGQTYVSSQHTSSVTECATCHMNTTTYAPACTVSAPACASRNGGSTNLTCTATSTSPNGYCACSSTADCAATEACSHGKCTDQNFGGHTFNMTYTPPGGTKLDHVSACASCHTLTTFDSKTVPDYASGNNSPTSGAQSGVQTEIDTLLTRLGGKLNTQLGTTAVPSSGLTTMTPKPTTVQLQAIWNYWYVTNDGSRGVHNTKYAAQLLCDSLKALDSADTCKRP